jgi:tRNA nucleotidyltransferase (CCA-adding enzyme)
VDDLNRQLEVPPAVLGIARRLEEHGHETWAVGGAVRDALLLDSRSDWDLATAARPDAVRKLFRPSYPIGIQFGTVGVRGDDGAVYEVTTFRRDIETDGRHAVVEYGNSIDEDLARRDFTINAIAYHPLRRTLHDPFSGLKDLQDRRLRCVGDPQLRFSEDYLRVLRGLRFAGRFGLEIESATWEALREAVPLLSRLSGERIREELLKTVSSGPASPSLQLYRRSGALAAVYPELSRITETSWNLLLRAVDSIPVQRFGLRVAALFAPAGPAVEAMMSRLRFSNAEIRKVLALVRALAAPVPEAGDEVAARRWLRAVEPEHARDALRLHFARAGGADAAPEARALMVEPVRLILRVLRRHDPVTIADLAIGGDDLKEIGLQPGPEFRRILDQCLAAVIEDPGLNNRETLLDVVRSKL